MTDIVDRLRAESVAALEMRMSFKEQLQAWETMMRAAAEIERLREEIATLTDRLESVVRDAQAAEAHFDRMMNEGP